MILETERLYFREIKQTDFNSLCKILQDEDTMYAYEGAFNDNEVILKETGEMIGQCGLTMQPWKEMEVLETGYLFNRLYWHKGYATEAANACIKYAFEVLKADEVCSIIRDINIASQNVAIRNGMAITDTWTKHYRGIDMPHYRYVIRH